MVSCYSGSLQRQSASILLVDEDPDQLETLQQWLWLCHFDAHVALDAHQALSLLQEHRFSLVITELKMPGLSGLQLLELIKGRFPQTQVIFLSGHGTMADAIAALRHGRAFDFVEKPIRDFHAFRQILELALQLSPPSSAPIAAASQRNALGALSDLDRRDLQILALVAQGLNNPAIGERLSLSGKTVRNRLSRIFEKLQVKNRVQAVATVQAQGLI